MKKLIATLIMLLLAGWIYSPVCLAGNVETSGDTSDKSVEITERDKDPKGTKDTDEGITNITNITISIPNSELKDKMSKVILITKERGEWQYVKKDFFAINFAWILLASAAVLSIAVNCLLIFLRKGR